MLVVGIAAFGLSFAALVVAAGVYVSSSAVAVKGLIDFRRLADDETDLILAILVFEDIVLAFVLGFAASGGGALSTTLWVALKALLFLTASVAAARFLVRPIDRLLAWLPREFFLLAIAGFVVGMAAIAEELALSEAIGALMAGVVLAETRAREEIEERFLSFRDVFAALFFFVFGLTIDVGALETVGWLVALAVVPLGRSASSRAATSRGLAGGFTRRQSLNVGGALVAHGEFTIILAQLAAGNAALPLPTGTRSRPSPGSTCSRPRPIGVVLMKESKRIGRTSSPPRLRTEEKA